MKQNYGDEKSEENRRGSIKCTGSLGEVMQESVQIAYTYAKDFCELFYRSKFLEANDIHIHFPEGASKKDGPSGGIAITSSLLSLAMDRPLPSDIAMTGEISLQGKVLKIGGVKEKLLAAKREGIKTVFFPRENKADVEELKDYIKQDIRILFADSYWDVVKVIFPGTFTDSEANIPKY